MVHRLVNTRLFGKVITHVFFMWKLSSYLAPCLLTILSNLMAKRNLRELPVSSVGYPRSSEIWPNEMNHIWPEYVKVGPGAVRDILRCGWGTHQYISRSHLSPSGVQSPGVGWDVGRVHKGGGVEELANRSISRVPRITSGSSGDTLLHNTLRAGQLLVPRLEKSRD